MEWQVFYLELVKQLGLNPDQHYKPLLDNGNGGNGKIKDLERKLSNIEAGAKRKEIVLRNLDSLLEHGDFDRAEYCQKRHACLLEIETLKDKMNESRKELDELRKRKSDEADFARFVSEADAFKAVTHKIMDLPFTDKQRLLRRDSGIGDAHENYAFPSSTKERPSSFTMSSPFSRLC